MLERWHPTVWIDRQIARRLVLARAHIDERELVIDALLQQGDADAPEKVDVNVQCTRIMEPSFPICARALARFFRVGGPYVAFAPGPSMARSAGGHPTVR